MATKIFVSQIDSTQPDGSTAAANSVLVLTSTGTRWIYAPELALTGYRGSAGLTGYAGSTGFKGSVGDQGPVGESGYQGSVGDQGPTGYYGSTGLTGDPGDVGYQGSAGFSGSVGDNGYMGSQGLNGNAGADGNQGPVGYQGSGGYFGSVGYTGSVGTIGPISFLSLSDVLNPDTFQQYTVYNDYGGRYVRVNDTRDALMFEPNDVVTSNVAISVVNFNTNIIKNPTFQGFGEYTSTYVVTSSITLDPSISNISVITLDSPVTNIILDETNLVDGTLYTMTIFIKQSNGGGLTLDWSLNPTLYWSNGIDPNNGPLLSTEDGYTDSIIIYTYNAGTTWLGTMGASGYPTS
jgi:hypothetical protein